MEANEINKVEEEKGFNQEQLDLIEECVRHPWYIKNPSAIVSILCITADLRKNPNLYPKGRYDKIRSKVESELQRIFSNENNPNNAKYKPK